ncbi:ABC transporter ATP-binding protein [Saccharococcus caldoxylosilyticus]|jgi:branched-chain amino acid transport system ATP-binding protein|uniref:Putative ABC transporter ATP-binding protein n=1 Tax=Parageobacillus caldoxylosilyticus NBRC 107762 TaxID=1220594 RepID=A0A023DIV4_9BACL|nr:ABC transporter ATP-binding protein [Parageobacillus caldoxylosilyticus]MBB3854213.1 branched-chain amino acid transport system ATP-binding protein [Parageobacillus caldoxylosilyticus]BDG35755.1 ABC transporter ATP-binding protein [Parageobacillus caldoxylosilyticus]BDG39536.1 ABC transporter ATP-binding protein [Parageobacillus caldoxylosilyticus]GAJ41187.1 putative ABC transporter ATP-binding protein [Parageobacillus caldoxylosilyticus NBRC 107762]
MLLEVHQLTKRFGGLVAVNDVSFSVEEGKVNAIIGPNGAGKSTFFNLISGFYKPTSGQIIFKGQDITRLPANQRAKLGIARTFQTTHLFEQSTVFDNVVIGHRLRTSSNLFDAVFRTKRLKREEAECKEKAMEVLEFVGLTDVADKMVANISQEQKKRAAFALALATEPEIVLLDEPAAGVNPDETEGLEQLIVKMVDHGITVCLIEHKMSMIMKIAHKIMVLNYGEKIAEGTPEEIQNNETVIKAYLGGSAIA